MNKKKKLIVIPLIVIGSLVFTYFVGGFTLTAIGGDLLNKRYSDISTLENDFYRIQKVRSDFISLAKREEITFKSNNEDLVGYFYECDNPIGTVLIAHGINNLADGNSAQLADYFVTNNYNVFSIDMVGCGRSSGRGIKSLHESKHCVINGVKVLKEKENTKDLPIFLVGHSWGAYGVVAASNYLDDISAVVSFSGYNLPHQMLYAFVEVNVKSSIFSFTQPIIDLSCHILYGEENFFKAETAIKNNKDIPYIVVQGEKDNIVPIKKFSLYHHIKDDNYDNVTLVALKEMFHGGPWKSLEATRYTVEVQEGLDKLRKQLAIARYELILKQYDVS